nr:unnamed protein product [Callosobruchus analis]
MVHVSLEGATGTRRHRHVERKNGTVWNSPTHCEDTLLKTLEFIFNKSQAETQSSRPGQSKGKQTRREAIIVKSNGRSYADLVRELRKDINLNAVDVEVSKIRKIQKGDLLLEVRKGKAEDLKTTTNNQMHGVQAARRTKQVVLHLRNLDSITTKEDIISALKDTLGDDVARCREREITGWCHRCWEMGHDRAKYRGPNRADLCFKCAKPGHAMKDWTNNPYCPLCNKPDAKTEN